MQISIPIAVGLGGCAGALLRYYISTAVARAAGEPMAFLGTTVVNLLGCFLIGLLTVLAARSAWLNPSLQKLLITGLLGSLTTFSTFAMESLNLMQHDRVAAGMGHMFGNLLLGLVLVAAGMLVAQRLVPPPAEVSPSTEDAAEIEAFEP